MSVAAPPVMPDRAPATETLAAYARRWWADVRAGELGSVPIIVGLVVIAIVFQVQNDRFLTAGNFVNLIVQTVAITTIAMGIVFVLLLGEIDLSIGYVSGVAGVLTAILLTPDGNVLPTPVVIVVALAAGAAIGVLHGLILTKVGVPSFVVTLAGLLAWNGVVLLLIGSRGTVILQNDFVVGLANNFMPSGLSWFLAIACAVIYAALQLARVRSRAKAGLPAEPVLLVAIRVGALLLALAIVVAVANQDRGIPYVGVLVAVLLVSLTFVLRRTRFGRHVYAVGGNAEAARRAGIDVDRIKIAVFAICSLMAVLGGI
ncbi:MAG: ABC transporter permease, partial [Actinomycetota bacterium]|nr:ABC transporter permease [Actinomycetota bacterium]